MDYDRPYAGPRYHPRLGSSHCDCFPGMVGTAPLVILGMRLYEDVELGDGERRAM